MVVNKSSIQVGPVQGRNGNWKSHGLESIPKVYSYVSTSSFGNTTLL